MSKSYGNTIPLFGSREEIQKAVMSIVTDSSGERPENVYAIHKLVRDEASLASLYEEKKGRYKDLKDALVEDLDTFIKPMREHRAKISDKDVANILKKGAVQARKVSEKKMETVRKAVGLR
jgi:tryptophanyl-tRNA synthetase